MKIGILIAAAATGLLGSVVMTSYYLPNILFSLWEWVDAYTTAGLLLCAVGAALATLAVFLVKPLGGRIFAISVFCVTAASGLLGFKQAMEQRKDLGIAHDFRLTIKPL